MENKQQEENNDFMNNNIQSDLEETKISSRKFKIYIGLISIAIVVFFFLFFFLKNFSLGLGGIESKKNDKDLAATVKVDKKFDNVTTFEEVLKEREEETKLPMPIAKKESTIPTNNLSPTFEAQIRESKPKRARIVKGMGITVIKGDASGSYAANSGEKQFKEKPDVVFDFGQNGNTPNMAANNLNGGNGEDSRMNGDVYTPTQAMVSNFNQSLLLPKGAYIGCVLKTKLVSTIKGGIACIVSNDVYSANGHTLLIEKGSTITGTFNSGQMNDGMDRLFVVWQEIRTPNNIVIPVYSGATDSLGASGVPGWVDHHYMQRFGAAIMLSVLDDAMGILANQIQNKTSNGNNNNYYDYSQNTRDQVSNIANTALEKMIDIKPTLYKNQGDIVGVYVNRDIDFSKVYKIIRRKK
ncbi:type IV secretion system protein VirB10 [Campylobacter fetus subsp. venerealis]|uniref:CmgB10 n=1 Tax=Campylobacter hyointestinalis subsp. hyointestinalis TaxID=91352 RepID=A0A9W5EZN0_CAMHY|nr:MULTISPECIES: type IV secretion system protein VirB10 [Campylobacter]MBC3781449.1 type IV secretion system protein VirB10 [Campylobacter fetus subsp. fetus]MBC3782903.1 type IV secretion system protein VirB10 [Campylobacter fetus subsp. venerealis]MBK3499223.1 type IV secretion system protein VirB10 [Campylobacter fetus subsp. venerealis]MBK3501166.1 type IV secretion system protein VirB10 [Campylobacter fetus subsp. venerealis]MBK3503187.1 type IV secretion system protein VirB10 [Campyloba